MEDFEDCGILIVDDERSIRNSLERLLQMEGYSKIFTADSGLNAIGLLETHGEDIFAILLDVRMPRMSGIDLMRHLLNTHKTPVGIILVTGYGSDEVVEEFFTLRGANVIPMDKFDKPFDNDKLLAAVRSAIQSIRRKRSELANLHSDGIHMRLDKIEDALRDVAKRQMGFLSMLGFDVLRILIITFALLALLVFGAGDFIRSVLDVTN